MNLFTKKTFLLLAIYALSRVYVQAQGPPIFSDSPILLGLEGGGVRTFGKYISKENVKTYIQPLIVPYNITPKFLVAGVVPFINKTPTGMPTQGGIGDVAVVAKYTIVQIDGKMKTFRIVGKVKQSFPTGSTKTSPALGSGAYQTQIGLVSGYVTTKFGIYNELGYNITTGNLPDNLVYNVAFGYPILPQKYPPKQVNLFLEFNGNYIIDNNANNLFISLGVQYIIGRRVLVETGIQLPLIENVPTGQQTNFMYTLGTRLLIF